MSDIKDWRLTDAQIADDEGDLHGHFGTFDHDDWIEVGEEGRRVLGLILSETIQASSTLADFTSAVAGAGYDASLRRLATVVGGIDAKELSDLLSYWFDDDPDAPVAIGWDALVRAVAEHAQMRAEWEAESAARSKEREQSTSIHRPKLCN